MPQDEMAAAPSRVTPIAFLGLLGDNASLVVVESVACLSTSLLLLHVHSSGKRNAAVWVAALFQVLLVELFLHSDDRWHAQSLLMAVPDRLPLYTVLLQAQLYYTYVGRWSSNGAIAGGSSRAVRCFVQGIRRDVATADRCAVSAVRNGDVRGATRVAGGAAGRQVPLVDVARH